MYFVGRTRLTSLQVLAGKGTLSNQWDALPPGDQAARTAVLGALRERVLERNYINNLLATIERETTGVGGPQL